MIQPERFRRIVVALWIGALAYFLLCWFTGMGWLGPFWVMTTWSYAALPLYALTVLWGRRARVIPGWEPFLVALLWAGLLLAPVFSASDRYPWTVLGFYGLVTLYTLFALLVVGRALRLLIAAQPTSSEHGARLPVRELVVLCAGYALAIAWMMFMALRPSYAIVATVLPDSTVDMADLVWDNVLSVPTEAEGETTLPEGVSSVVRIHSRDGMPALQIRFTRGASERTRAALVNRLRVHPSVVTVEYTSNL